MFLENNIHLITIDRPHAVPFNMTTSGEQNMSALTFFIINRSMYAKVKKI